MIEKLLPILTVLVGGLLVYLAGVIHLSAEGITILKAIILFLFGLSMSPYRKRKQRTWFKKVIIAFVVFFLMVWQMGFIAAPELARAFQVTGLTEFGFALIYIYCGWVFFD